MPIKGLIMHELIWTSLSLKPIQSRCTCQSLAVCEQCEWSQGCSDRVQNVCSYLCLDLVSSSLQRGQLYFACTHLGWWGSRFHKMAAILNRKQITFLYFSLNLFWLFQRNTAATLLGIWRILAGNMTWNDLDLGKWRPFYRSEYRNLSLQFPPKWLETIFNDF